MQHQAAVTPGSPGETGAPAPAAAVLRRLPGKARPREEALRAYWECNLKRRDCIPAVLWPFLAPGPEEFYRWRVQLDCGCIKEVLTTGPSHRPDATRWADGANDAWLPAGQVICVHNAPALAPYREIATWGERREVTFPADPVEPPDWATAETWAVTRHGEPHSRTFWKATLACGHVTEVPADLDWNPADGPKRVSAGRQQEMTTEWEQFWTEQPNAHEPHEREHTRRMLTDGWPIPQPERNCHTCSLARTITACQRIGWLVPRPPEPKSPKALSLPKPPSRTSLRRQLREAESRAGELRRQLTELDAAAKQQR